MNARLRSIQKIKNNIQCDGFFVAIVRTERKKTIAFKVVEGKASIVVPKTLSHREIADFVHKKQSWIKEKLEFHQSLPEIKPKNFVAGESFAFLGQSYKLEVEIGNYPHLFFQENRFTAFVRNPEVDNSHAVKALFKQWYQLQAENFLCAITEKCAKKIGVKPGKITFKSFKSRWGSCSSRGDIQYNWRIIMAPENIIHYLVVHELCHILQHNHSPQYWQLVSQYHPEYKKSRAWLKMNGRYLEF